MFLFLYLSEKRKERQSSRFMMMMMIPVVVVVVFCVPMSMFNKEKKSYKESCFPYLFLKGKKHWNTQKKEPRGTANWSMRKKVKQRCTVSNLKCFHILLHLYCFSFFFRHHTTHLSTFLFLCGEVQVCVYILWEIPLLWITQTFIVKYLIYIK